MFNQVAILSDVIRREHALAASPTRLERRRRRPHAGGARLLHGPSLAARLRSVIGRPATSCSATG